MGKYNDELNARRDIERCKDVLENYGDDTFKLSSLFFDLITAYSKVEGFSKDLQVVNEHYDKEKAAKTYRFNIALMEERLEDYVANKCEGLSRHTVKNPEYISELFDAGKVKISMMDSLSDSAKSDILKRLDEIKAICLSEDSAEVKWEKMRPHIMWLSGKDVRSALIILPLITHLD